MNDLWDRFWAHLETLFEETDITVGQRGIFDLGRTDRLLRLFGLQEATQLEPETDTCPDGLRSG